MNASAYPNVAPPPVPAPTAVVKVEELSAAYVVAGHRNQVLNDVDLIVESGQILGLAGESGCGKSTLGLAVVGFPVPGLELAGRVTIAGRDVLSMRLSQRRQIWGSLIAHIPQNSATSLNPAVKVGRQMIDPVRKHLGVSTREARRVVAEALELVQLRSENVLRRYPHEFSGGQQQRLALALAVVCKPSAIVLDEPTTGLDVTTQVQVSAVVADVVRETGAAAIYISHDIGLLSAISDRLAVMYAGEIVEVGSTSDVLDAPRHPYTGALIAAVPSIRERRPFAGLAGMPPPGVVLAGCSFAPRCVYAVAQCVSEHPQLEARGDRTRVRCIRPLAKAPLQRQSDFDRHGAVATAPRTNKLLVAERLSRRFGKGQLIPAVRDVTFSIARGEVVAVVGESGSGKSTLLRMLVGLDSGGTGDVLLAGMKLPPQASRRSIEARAAIQLIPQNPDSSLNPRRSVLAALRRPIQVFRPDLRSREEQVEEVRELIGAVGMSPNLLSRYPHELSGGQRQRVAIARALAARPQILLCDEITSSLDVSVQTATIELLLRLVRQFDMATLFVSHNLALVRGLADRILVMCEGEVCEAGYADAIFDAPEADYTRALLASATALDVERAAVP